MQNAKFKFKIQNYLKQPHIILILILVLGLFLRIYKAKELFLYSHDQDLAGWIIKDILVNKHPRLIGQETSTQGIFIGPLFYYLLIPFYLVFNMDPIGGVFLVTLLGLFAIFSFYFVFSKLFNQKAGLVAAFLYAVSFYTVFNDREVVPTMPVIVWSAWFFYGINLLLKGKQKAGFILLGVLIGLIWHINATLVLLIPIIPISQYLSKKKLDLKAVIQGVFLLTIISLPLILFELRHNFRQLRALHLALTTQQYAIVSGHEKFVRTLHLASKNVSGFIWGPLVNISFETVLYALLALFVALALKGILSKKWAIVMSLWIVIYLLFFSLYSKILSEYYLNGMMVMWIAILAIGNTYLLSIKRYRFLGILVLIFFGLINVYRILTKNINRSGYLERKAVVSEIRRDAEERGFPCVAVSYITDPGYDLGYRYLFWLEDMHVNHPESGSPVYTIVFPLKPIFGVDKTFGALGLINPDYKRYTMEGVEKSCSGKNSNLTDPVFGYTE